VFVKGSLSCSREVDITESVAEEYDQRKRVSPAGGTVKGKGVSNQRTLVMSLSRTMGS